MTTRPFERILTVADLETTSDRLGNFFFTPGAMDFFKSRIDYRLYNVDNERGYFVTSEKYGDAPRHYAVRQYAVSTNAEGKDVLVIDSVSDNYKFYSKERARSAAEELQGYALIDPKSFDIER